MKKQTNYPYIGNYADFLKDSTLQAAITEINVGRLKKMYNIPLETVKGDTDTVKLFGTEVKFRGGSADFETVEQNFKNACEKYGSIDKARLFIAFDSAFFTYGLRHTEKNDFVINDKSFATAYLFYFLNYIINGELSEDFVKINKFIDDNKIYNLSNFELKNIAEYGNISVKKFQNGKVTIKGLDEDQINKAVTLQKFMLVHRYIS